MPSTQILRHFLILEKLLLCFTSDKSRYHSLRLPRVIIVFLFLRIVLPSAFEEGKFRNHPGGTDGITEISDGALHVKGGPHELGSHMELKEPFGDNTITSFRVKTIKSDPEAFINFFMGRRGRLAIILRDTNIHIFADGPEAKFNRFLQKKGIIGGEWNDITVAIVNLEVMLFVDQILVSSFKVPEGLPPQGHLNFEGHSEFWIDDLKIRSVSRFERLE